MTTPPPPYPQQGPGQPGPMYPPPPKTGAIAWGMGLLVLLCVPFVGSLAAGIAMTLVGRAQRTKGELAAENGRRAANFGLTYVLATVLLVGAHFGLLWALTKDGDSIEGFFPFGAIITVWGVLTLIYLVFSVLGMIKANGRKLFSAPAIPFFRN